MIERSKTEVLVSFRENRKLRAATEYQQRRSKSNPFLTTAPCLKAACSKLAGDHQPRNRLSNNQPDYNIHSYDPIQNVRRVNFLRRRPMLLAAQSDEKCIATDVRGLEQAMKPGPKLEKFEQITFRPYEIALLKLPIPNKGVLAKQLPSVLELKSVQEANEIAETAAKLKRFATRFQKVFLEDEYLKAIRKNEGLEGPYTGLKPYIPRPTTPKPNPYDPFIVDRQPVNDIKFRSDRLDYFHFPVDYCPMRDYLNQGQTWMSTHVRHEPKWVKHNYLPKKPPRPFPHLEDESFTRYPRPRTPYSRYLEKVAGELALKGPFDEYDTRGKVAPPVTDSSFYKRKAKTEIILMKKSAAKEVEEIEDEKPSTAATIA